MNKTVSEIANYIWIEETGSSDQTTTSEIAYYIDSAGLGKLNSLIFTDYSIDPDTYEIVPDIGREELAILGAIYKVKFLTRMNENSLGASGVSDILEVSDDGATVRKQSRSTMAQQWASLKKGAQEELLNLIGSYKIYKSSPVQVVGEDSLMTENISRYNRAIE